MNRDSMNALRLDRRLLRRRGWITPDELEQQLADLPDVADKAQTVEQASDAAGQSAPDTPESEGSTGF
jgi:hypothetical protein